MQSSIIPYTTPMDISHSEPQMQVALFQDDRVWRPLLKMADIFSSNQSQQQTSVMLKKMGFGSMPQSRLNELLVLATKYGSQDFYNPAPAVHLKIVKTLLKRGAEISVVASPTQFQRKILPPQANARDEHMVPFAQMFDRSSRTPISDIELLIDEKILRRVRWANFAKCIAAALRRKNLPALQILMKSSRKFTKVMESKFEFWVSAEILRFVEIFDVEAIALAREFRFLAMKIHHPVAEWEGGSETGALQLRSIMLMGESYLHPLHPASYESSFDFLLAKGFPSPSPLVLMAMFLSEYPLLFTVVYLCFKRGVPIHIPDISFSNQEAEESYHFQPEAAEILAQMMRRSGHQIPQSYLDFLGRVSGKRLEFPSLTEMAIAAVRNNFLEADKKESFPESMVLLDRNPARPTLILPPNIVLPEPVRAKVLLKDLYNAFHGHAEEWNWK